MCFCDPYKRIMTKKLDLGFYILVNNAKSINNLPLQTVLLSKGLHCSSIDRGYLRGFCVMFSLKPQPVGGPKQMELGN